LSQFFDKKAVFPQFFSLLFSSSTGQRERKGMRLRLEDREGGSRQEGGKEENKEKDRNP